MNFGAALITSTQAGDLVSTITGAITDNVAAVLVVLGTLVGYRIAVRFLNGGLKGKLKV